MSDPIVCTLLTGCKCVSAIDLTDDRDRIYHSRPAVVEAGSDASRLESWSGILDAETESLDRTHTPDASSGERLTPNMDALAQLLAESRDRYEANYETPLTRRTVIDSVTAAEKYHSYDATEGPGLGADQTELLPRTIAAMCNEIDESKEHITGLGPDFVGVDVGRSCRVLRVQQYTHAPSDWTRYARPWFRATVGPVSDNTAEDASYGPYRLRVLERDGKAGVAALLDALSEATLESAAQKPPGATSDSAGVECSATALWHRTRLRDALLEMHDQESDEPISLIETTSGDPTDHDIADRLTQSTLSRQEVYRIIGEVRRKLARSIRRSLRTTRTEHGPPNGVLVFGAGTAFPFVTNLVQEAVEAVDSDLTIRLSTEVQTEASPASGPVSALLHGGLELTAHWHRALDRADSEALATIPRTPTASDRIL